ncbi:MAG: hypothetical protein AAFN77_22055 [Planctomycetota bacterium]
MLNVIKIFALLLVAVVNAQVQEPEVPLTRSQRLTIAKQLLKRTREKAISDLSSPERRYQFAEHWARIDPQWTARFIVDHPVDSKDGPQVVYDNKAVAELMNRINQLDDDSVISVLQAMKKFQGIYQIRVRTALEKLSPKRSQLRQRLLGLVNEERDESLPPNLMDLSARLSLAKASKDAEAEAKVRRQIEEFYNSERFSATIKQIRKVNQEGYQLNAYAMLMKHAPEALRDQVKVPAALKSQVELQVAVMQASELDAKSENGQQAFEPIQSRLNTIERLKFGQFPHEQIQTVSKLKRVADVAPEQALRLARQAPNGYVESWVLLQLSPRIAQRSPAEASKLILESYEMLSDLDPKHQASYNFPTALIAAKGLTIVAAVAPQHMQRCLKITVNEIDKLPDSIVGRSDQNMFRAIACLAKFDQRSAQKMFDKVSIDVELSAAPEFFLALAALEPDQVADEYKSLPMNDQNQTRLRVRSTLLPIWLAEDEAFWDEMFASGLLSVGRSK